jgi:hypothetical protein
LDLGIEDVVNGLVEETPAVEAPPVAETPVVEEAPATETSEEAPPAVEAPVVEEQKGGQEVPLPTFLDMRDRAKAAEARLAELEAKKPEPTEVPDPYDDPKGFAAHVKREAEALATNNRFQLSDVIARREFGADTVQTATDWALDRAKSDPSFAQQYMREAHPIDWIVRQHKEAADIEDYRKDPAAFARRILEASGEAAPATTTPVVVVPQQAPMTPRRSIAAEPSTGGGVKDVPVHPLAALEAVFNR